MVLLENFSCMVPPERLVSALIRPDDLRFAEPTYRRFRAAADVRLPTGSTNNLSLAAAIEEQVPEHSVRIMRQPSCDRSQAA